VALPAFAAACRAVGRLLPSAGQQSIDILCSPDPQLQQTRSGEVRRADGTETDGHRTVTQWRQREFKVVGGTSLVSRLSACLAEANWWRLTAE